MTAQETVFSTPELCVSILCQLPHSSLLQAQLVSKSWASLFDQPQIQAALFKRPWPKGSSSPYIETHSDVLSKKFPGLYPTNSKKGRDEWDICYQRHFPGSPRPRKIRRLIHRPPYAPAIVDEIQDDKCADDKADHLQWLNVQPMQWRDLLICHPPIETLEFVQYVNRRGGHDLEFRGLIHRAGGIRMGFLYDAIKEWYDVEQASRVKVLWNRRTGDLIDHYNIYPDGPGYKTAEDKPCITIWGRTSVGCGQHGGLTYRNYCSTSRREVGQSAKNADELDARILKSGNEEVEYLMLKPQELGYDGHLFSAYLKASRAK